ncbi:tRNA (5-methylaminomethyl-2-thiouridine)(34)-methyltransferase MnmD [bacterium]|nr:tRNA (5-methylaminomethyl-2-thiouridine)(34)-methyltransferase MnmD [bacterium]
MKRSLFTTKDGSHSIMVEELRESFHSQNGSLQESEHTFIKSGLSFLFDTFRPPKIELFEVGFGTGLNALLSYLWAVKDKVHVAYTGIEAFPLENELWQSLNYSKLIDANSYDAFSQMHRSDWNTPIALHEFFSFEKTHGDLVQHAYKKSYNLVYFDAFAPSVQPELWTDAIFKNLYDTMLNPAVLVTYSAAGQPRRAMTKAGFWLDEIRGAAGKREMTRALKM